MCLKINILYKLYQAIRILLDLDQKVLKALILSKDHYRLKKEVDNLKYYK